jgi:hypothetical protein
MKKQLLLSSSMMVALFFSSHAQIINKANVTRKLTNADRKTMFKVSKSDAVSSETSTETFIGQVNNNSSASRSASVATNLAVTKYDLQTNGAIGNRASRNADGTGHANYTFGTDPQPSPVTRGTGYNYYNGTSWSAAPTARIEPARTGWGDYAVLPNGKELIIAHGGTSLQLSTRAAKGTGAWATTTLLNNTDPSLTGVNLVWPRIAAGGSNGQTVHIICNTVGVQTGVFAPKVNGVKTWLIYLRSTDGGVTFTNQAMPTLDSLNYRGDIGGDNYSIDCKGDTVAVVVAASGHDVQLAKSIDGGVTWAKTVIVQVPAIIDGDVVPVLPNGDTAIVIASDNSSNVLIDKNNKVHVFWGILRMTDAIPNDGSVNLFTSPSGIAHWTEGQPFGTADAGSIIADVKDLNGDTTINLITRPTLATTVGRTGFSGLVSHPYTGYDNNNNIYVSYDGLVEDTTYLDPGDPASPNKERMMKHVYMIKGKVNPTNPIQWCFTNSDSALDIVDPALFGNVEGIFACISRRNNSNDILVQWQEDNVAGTSLSNATAHPAPNNNGTATINIKSDFIGLNSFGNSSVCEVLSIQNGGLKIEDVVRLYPNPSNGQLNLKVKAAAKNVSIEIVNLVGQSVYASKVAVGLNKINVTSLNPGVYFANITVDGVKTSQKLVIE